MEDKPPDIRPQLQATTQSTLPTIRRCDLPCRITEFR